MEKNQEEFEIFSDEQEKCDAIFGIEFNDAIERKEYFNKKLESQLPKLRERDGFPVSSDSKVLSYSDSPFYTACPNPWINDFISLWENEKKPRDEYSKTFYAGDISEGKSDPIYNVHSYHTKVPPKAIVRYLLHYTEPGDIVYDGFCGTGMTGVAANMCSNPEIIRDLGYTVNSSNEIIDENGNVKSFVGERKAILGDLSPIATFIAKNYNSPFNKNEFEKEAESILKKAEDEFGWMYETVHENGDLAKVNYMVWSQVYTCPSCTEEIIFTDVAVDYRSEEHTSELQSHS